MLIDERMRNLAKLLDVSELRAAVHAGNIANQNTPGYKARAVAFEDAFRQELDRRGGDAARQLQPTVYQPENTAVDNDGNDVSMVHEVSQSTQNNMLYASYVAMMRGKFRVLTTAISGGA
jgi:flagellar basal-body rod protein FlgB